MLDDIRPPDDLADVPRWLREFADAGEAIGLNTQVTNFVHDLSDRLAIINSLRRQNEQLAAQVATERPRNPWPVTEPGRTLFDVVKDFLRGVITPPEAEAELVPVARFTHDNLSEVEAYRHRIEAEHATAYAMADGWAPVPDTYDAQAAEHAERIEQLVDERLADIRRPDPLNVHARCESICSDGQPGAPWSGLRCVRGTPHAWPHFAYPHDTSGNLTPDAVKWGYRCPAVLHAQDYPGDGLQCEMTHDHRGLHGARLDSPGQLPQWWQAEFDAEPSPVAGSVFGIPADTPVEAAVPLPAVCESVGPGGLLCVDYVGHEGACWSPRGGFNERVAWDSTSDNVLITGVVIAPSPDGDGWGAPTWAGPATSHLLDVDGPSRQRGDQ